MSVAVAVPEAPRGSYREMWLITLGHSLTHWYPATFYLILPIIGKELALTYSQIGLIMTCQYIAGAVANIPGGVLVDTVGRKGVLMATSLFWVGFPYLLMGFTHSYLMRLGCVALVGFGNSLWHPTAIPTLARRFPERKGLVLSLHGMGGNVGDCMFALQTAGFAAAPVAGHLSDRMGRKSVMMTSMAMTAVVLVFMALAGKSLAFVFFVAVLGFFLYAIRPVLQAWLLETTPKNMGGTSIGVLFGAQAVGSAIGPLLGGLVADSYGLIATFAFLAGTIVAANLFILFMPKTEPARV